MKDKTIYVIVGPTAVGKTTAAIHLAQYLDTKIISADSRQCFRELNIGVAKPSLLELQTVPHFFINSHSIQEEVNAALFEQLSLGWANNIFAECSRAVMVGGTGLYIKAFCDGMDDMPSIDPEIRKSIKGQYDQNGIVWLQEEIKKKDPVFFSKGEIQNPQRLMRALEVKMGTDKSILDFQSKSKKERPFKIVKIGLQLPKEKLHNNINARVDLMIKDGLEEEVKSLLAFKHLNALQTVGYTEIFKYFEGEISREKAIEQIKTNTRQYAKRQMTWFKRDDNIQWIGANDMEELKNLTEK